MQGMPLEPEPESAANEARACLGLCALKEFLCLATLFMICADLVDVYANIIRVTGTDLLPFPGNHTELYYTAIPELNIFDLCISTLDLIAIVLLSLSVCTSSIDGIVCSLCGFATCMVLELMYVIWLCVAVAVDATREGLGSNSVWQLLLYTVVPYLALFMLRCYILVKSQALRRSLKKNKEFRRALTEKDRLMGR